MKEVKLKRFAGPLDKIPFKNFIQSLIGLVMKQNGDKRLIFHLSNARKTSLNAYTLKELCSVKYRDLDHAIRLCLQAGPGAYMAKSDMKSAFRNLPIRPEDWK